MIKIKGKNIKEIFISLLESKYLFFLLLVFNIVILCLTKFFPTNDGSAHVYNSFLIKELVFGNELVSQYYEFNYFFSPNWGTHFILSILHVFFPFWLVEKIFIIIYVCGIALSFRFLIRQINPQAQSLSVFIFPAIYTFLFLMGFFNFSFSFILLFFTLALWIKYYPCAKYKHYIIFSLLFVYTYYTNLLTLFFLGVSMGLYSIYYTWLRYRKEIDAKPVLKDMLKKLSLLFIASLPALILFFLFYRYVEFDSFRGGTDALTVFKWLNGGRPIIMYSFDVEIYTAQIVNLLIAILTISFVKTEEKRLWLQAGDILFIPLLIALYLLFTTHPDSNAAMMDIRYATIVFILSVAWVIGRAKRLKINTVFIVLLIFFHVKLMFSNHKGMRIQNDKALAIYKSADYVEENSLVIKISLNPDWPDGHIYNYIAYKKPLLLLSNYESDLKWFPLKRKNNDFADYSFMANYIDGVNDFVTKDLPGHHNGKYILLIGDRKLLNEAEYAELNEVLQQSCLRTYISDNSYASLYKVY